jgi:ankyrin repeat protein
MNPEEITLFLRAAGTGKLDTIRKALAHGCPVNAVNHLGYTLLMSACASYRVEMVKRLLAAGADVNMKTNDDRTALHAAISSTPSLPEDQAQCVRLLIDSGADLDAQDQSGCTPLMSAAWFGCTLAVKELLSQKASRHIRDKQGRTAEDLAKAKSRMDILEILKDD